jgi:hypothetical protein
VQTATQQLIKFKKNANEQALSPEKRKHLSESGLQFTVAHFDPQ